MKWLDPSLNLHLTPGCLFKVYASAKKGNYSDVYRLNIRMEGDLLNIQTGQVIGGFETSAFDKPVLPANCDKDCVYEEVGKHSRVLGQDLARAIRAQLQGYLRAGGVSSMQKDSTAIGSSVTSNSVKIGTSGNDMDKDHCEGFPQSYAMKFIGFENDEHSVIEEFLDSFSCVNQMRNLGGSSGSQFGFWYETSANDSVLRRNLRTMLDYMDVAAQFNFAGNQIEITKVPTR